MFFCGVVSMSPVPFPIGSFEKRIERISMDIGKRLMSVHPDSPAPPQVALPLISKCFFEESGFHITKFGRSNLQERLVQ